MYIENAFNENGIGGICYKNKNVQHNLSKIFEKASIDWIKNIKRYTNDFDSEDCLYYYNERATLSTFSGSLYKSGYFILEEFSSIKHLAEEDKKKLQETNGRVDLYFGKSGTDGYIIEAKQINISIASKTYSLCKVFKSLAEAYVDLKLSFPPIEEYLEDGFAISFIVPKIKSKIEPSKSKEKSIELINTLKMELNNSNYLKNNNCNYENLYKHTDLKNVNTTFDMLIYAFPKHPVYLEYENSDYYSFPGVICLIKQLDKKDRL